MSSSPPLALLNTLWCRISPDSFQKMMEVRENRVNIYSFLDHTHNMKIFFINEEVEAGFKLFCTIDIPMVELLQRSRCICFLKEDTAKVPYHDPASILLWIELKSSVYDELSTLCKEVFFPLFTLRHDHKGLNNTAIKEFPMHLSDFICSLEILKGKSHNSVVLPLPTGLDFQNSDSFKHRAAVTLMENTVLSWTKQIQYSIAKDSEDISKTCKYPLPSMGDLCFALLLSLTSRAEIAFWRFRSDELDYICAQLNDSKIITIISLLRKSQSTYCNAFDLASQGRPHLLSQPFTDASQLHEALPKRQEATAR